MLLRHCRYTTTCGWLDDWMGGLGSKDQEIWIWTTKRMVSIIYILLVIKVWQNVGINIIIVVVLPFLQFSLSSFVDLFFEERFYTDLPNAHSTELSDFFRVDFFFVVK